MEILISTRHVNLLRRYSAKTGTSIDQCVHCALTEWFRKQAPATVTQVSLPHSTEVVAGQTLGVPSSVACNGSDSRGIVGTFRQCVGEKLLSYRGRGWYWLSRFVIL